jgi:hypothetical protein
MRPKPLMGERREKSGASVLKEGSSLIDRREQRGDEREAEDGRARQQRLLGGAREQGDGAGGVQGLLTRNGEAAAHQVEQAVAEPAAQKMQAAAGNQHYGRRGELLRARDLPFPARLFEALLSRAFGAFRVVVGHGVRPLLPAPCAGE